MRRLITGIDDQIIRTLIIIIHILVVAKGRARGENNLDFIIARPHVACQRSGTTLNRPGGQGKLVAELVHVGFRAVCPESVEVVGQPFERVRTGAQQDVTERAFSGRHVCRQQVPLHL